MSSRKEAISQLRDVLVRRRNTLRNTVFSELTMLSESRDVASGNLADVAQDQAQHNISSQLVEVNGCELNRILSALCRMDEGTYGDCEICGEKISLARLRALPYASACIKCQRKCEDNGIVADQKVNWGRLQDSLVEEPNPQFVVIQR